MSETPATADDGPAAVPPPEQSLETVVDSVVEPAVEPAAEVPLRRLSPLTPLARSGIVFAAAAVTAGRNVIEGEPIGVIAGILVLVLIGGLVVGFVSWWRTHFRITAEELRIDTGLLTRQSRRVRLDRIVAIDLNQPLIARLLGLAEVRIETATTEAEVTLAFLRLADAREIRTILLHHRRPQAVGQEHSLEPGALEPRPLLDVRVSWHLISLLASGETIVLVLMGLTVSGLFLAGADLGAMGFGIATVGGVALSFARKLVGRWRWRVGEVPSGVQVRHGMFNKLTQTFPTARLQGVSVSEPLLWRPWGLAALEVSVAGGLGSGNNEEGISAGQVIPAAPRELVVALAQDLIGSDALGVPLTPPPSRAGWLDPFGKNWLGFGRDDRLLVSRSGFWNRTTVAVPLARAQSFRVAQGPLQRRLRLASLVVDTPDGSRGLVAPHRDQSEARAELEAALAEALAARSVRTPSAPAKHRASAAEPTLPAPTPDMPRERLD